MESLTKLQRVRLIFFFPNTNYLVKSHRERPLSAKVRFFIFFIDFNKLTGTDEREIT